MLNQLRQKLKEVTKSTAVMRERAFQVVHRHATGYQTNFASRRGTQHFKLDTPPGR